MTTTTRTRKPAAKPRSKATTWVPPKSAPARPQPRGGFFKGESNIYMQGWRPSLRDINDDVRSAWRLGTARAIEALQNSGWLAGGIDEAIAQTMGTGLKLNSKPDGDELGWSPEETSEWARRTERRFEAWASDKRECDLTGRYTLHQQVASAYRLWFGAGEILCQFPLRRRPWSRTVTKVHMLTPMMISTQSDSSKRLTDGVFIDSDHAPIAMLLRVKDPVTNIETDQVLRLYDGYGRPSLLHVYEGQPGQYRGITPMAPALKVVRQYDQLADATLTNSLMQTIFAAVLKSGSQTAQALQGIQTVDEQGNQVSGMEGYMAGMAEFYKNVDIDLSIHGKIPHLFPGDDLEFKRVENPTDRYETFSKGLLREVARCLGITYEQLTGDYSQATYSSVRMATSNIWQIVMARRGNIVAPCYQSAFECWLEEDIAEGHTPCTARGLTGLDAFLAFRSALCRGDWRGPARPTADDYKTSNAQKNKLMMGVTTLELEAAEYGQDWEDILAQSKRERDAYAAAGIKHPVDAERGRGQNEPGAQGKTGDEPGVENGDKKLEDAE